MPNGDCTGPDERRRGRRLFGGFFGRRDSYQYADDYGARGMGRGMGRGRGGMRGRGRGYGDAQGGMGRGQGAGRGKGRGRGGRW